MSHFHLCHQCGIWHWRDAATRWRCNACVLLIDTDSQAHAILVGWRHPSLRISGLLVTKMNTRIRGHNHLLDELKAHSVLGKLLLGVIPASEAVSYTHHNHLSRFTYDPNASASKAYAQVVAALVRYMTKGTHDEQ